MVVDGNQYRRFYPQGNIQLFAVNRHTHTHIDLVSFICVIYRVKQTYCKQEVSGVKVKIKGDG